MRERPLVEAVDLQLDAMKVEVDEQVALERARGFDADPAAAEARVNREASGLDDPVALVRRQDDPSAMIRSLGPPPLPGRETIAENYFALAYDKAARRAVALAAASGLMDMSEPED